MKITQLFKRSSPYRSLNTITIDSGAILHNLQVLQRLQSKQTIIPVLKSNAYGHGLKEIGQILNQTSDTTTPLLAVDSYPEYQILRDYTRKSVLVLGETLPENYHLYHPRRTHLAVGSLSTLQALIKTGKKRNIHLFVNTGMNREGFQEKELGQALEVLKHSQHLWVAGVMSHLVTADEQDEKFLHYQVTLFKKQLLVIKSYGHRPLYVHIANSAGLAKISDPLFTASRAGLSFYGYNPFVESDTYHKNYKNLRPALSVTTTITALQHLKAGDIVSYGGIWKATKGSTVATIAFGYYEGLPRESSGGYVVSSRESYYPFIGRICMNLSNISLGENGDELKIGDNVDLITNTSSAENSLMRLAYISKTIPYQILVGLHPKLKRIIV